MQPKPWTDKDKKVVAELYPKLTAPEVAKVLGRTTNAIIGQANRMGLAKKKPSGRYSGYQRQPYKKLTPKPKPVIAKVTVSPLPGYIGPIPLLESTSSQCKAVVDGIDRLGLAMVCGKSVDIGSSFSFCSDHLEKYVQKRSA